MMMWDYNVLCPYYTFLLIFPTEMLNSRTVLYVYVMCMFPGVKSFKDVLQLYKSAKSSLGEILSAFEMADFEAINSTVTNLKLP